MRRRGCNVASKMTVKVSSTGGQSVAVLAKYESRPALTSSPSQKIHEGADSALIPVLILLFLVGWHAAIEDEPNVNRKLNELIWV